MNLEIELGGKTRRVEIERDGRSVRARIDGRTVEADAMIVAPGVYSILLGGQSFEVRVTPMHDGLHVHSAGENYVAQVRDPRSWHGRQSAGESSEGRKQIVAPMPGKVVRLLVHQGDAVEAGKGLLVVEAMKMQNEIKAMRPGKVVSVMVSESATVVAGGTGRPEGFNRGYFVRPTVFANVTNDMTIAKEEIFGPVLAILPYKDEEDAIRIANDTVYGLSGYVQSGSLERARRVASRLRTGNVHLNGAQMDMNAPFGGYKQSGNGREAGIFGLRDFMEVKAISGLPA